MGLAVLLPRVTGFTLVTGLMSMTGVRIETTNQIMAHTIVITTGTITVMTGIVMTDIMTSTTANIITGVMTGDMTTEVDTGLHTGVLLVDHQIALGLMTAVQTT